jgi:hypothetical protein
MQHGSRVHVVLHRGGTRATALLWTRLVPWTTGLPCPGRSLQLPRLCARRVVAAQRAMSFISLHLYLRTCLRCLGSRIGREQVVVQRQRPLMARAAGPVPL